APAARRPRVVRPLARRHVPGARAAVPGAVRAGELRAEGVPGAARGAGRALAATARAGAEDRLRRARPGTGARAAGGGGSCGTASPALTGRLGVLCGQPRRPVGDHPSHRRVGEAVTRVTARAP